ncbi:MFS transporter [Adhaeretor mobilis]|uniref:Putative transporter n=1 Tax=Adhaeretor mobilis TaxID=1930276 RepID=A0A517MX05_9BACT|nr:MFS transporter [Adhaeretor mobilis]QDS99414.1 putative transporter [Adhaeretor mobilis]
MLQSVYARYREAYSGLPREVWLMAFALFINRCGTMVMPFLTLFLRQERGMSESSAGMMLSAFGLGAIVGAYIGGRLVPLVGAVRVQISALLLVSPCFLLIPLAESWQGIAAAMFALGVTGEAVFPANNAAIALLTTRENRVRGFALQRLAANLGFSFGPAIGGVLAEIDFRLLFAVDGATTALGALLLLYFFGFRRLANTNETAAEKPTVVAAPLKDRTFVVFLVLVFLAALPFFQFWSTYPLYLKDQYGFSKPMIGAMFAFNTTIIVLTEMILVDAAKKWSQLRTIGWGCFLACFGFGILPYGVSIAFAALSMFIITVGEMLSHPLASGFVADRSPEGGEGPYMGWFSMVFSVCFIVGPASGAALYEQDPRLVWACSMVFAFVVLLGFLVLARVSETELATDDTDENRQGEPCLIEA